ncbi:hypothetical protein Tco_1064609, partial [Tanacetum coccineum]
TVIAVKGPPVQREPLKHRDHEVDLDCCFGKTQVNAYISYVRIGCKEMRGFDVDEFSPNKLYKPTLGPSLESMGMWFHDIGREHAANKAKDVAGDTAVASVEYKSKIF